MRNLCMFDFFSSPRIGYWCSGYWIQPCRSLDLCGPHGDFTLLQQKSSSLHNILVKNSRCNNVFYISLYSRSRFSIFRSLSCLISAVLALFAADVHFWFANLVVGRRAAHGLCKGCGWQGSVSCSRQSCWKVSSLESEVQTNSPCWL